MTPRDDLSAMRGIFLGCFLGLAAWLVIAFLTCL